MPLRLQRSAALAAIDPGRRVRQKAGLNRSILDQGWAEFRRQLEYKLSWNGGMLVAIPAHHTSQTCPECGHVSPDNRQTQAVFACVACGHTGNADWVAAVNILERGHRLSACGEDARRARPVRAAHAASKKQEPTEEIRQELAHV